jgi:malate dehydrogenase (oxaloacetate-decarboxylating)(NADP+)
MALVSHSDFGSSKEAEGRMISNVVERLHREYPELIVDGEMQIQNALNMELRDANYPFSRLVGREVNTLIFPNLTAANSAFRLMLETGVGEAVGPIQIGLNKPVHFVSVNAPVRDILNLTAIAVIDARTDAQLHH